MWGNSTLRLLEHPSCEANTMFPWYVAIVVQLYHDTQRLGQMIHCHIFLSAVIERNTKILESTSESNPISHSSITVTLNKIQKRKHAGQTRNYENTRGDYRAHLLCDMMFPVCLSQILYRLMSLIPLFKWEFIKRNCSCCTLVLAGVKLSS